MQLLRMEKRQGFVLRTGFFIEEKERGKKRFLGDFLFGFFSLLLKGLGGGLFGQGPLIVGGGDARGSRRSEMQMESKSKGDHDIF